uniref:Aminotransferase class I/classII large domain-containing protein n=1 Tax=Electrophorus electricus TaxID=8005 RepID=A0A4W4G4V4_ELEEL
MSRQLHARRVEGFDKNIWVEFTQLISDYKVVNLGQGFPDFGPPSFMQEAYCNAICGGASMHQYTRAFGYPRLVKIIAKFFGRIMGREIDPMEEVLITVGAYHALFCTFQALVDEGDEVIIVEPFFDCYEPMVMMAGGTPVYIPLKPVFQRDELQMIADLCIKHDVLCISDEVYEWLTYDGEHHIKIASLPGMWERTVTIGSAGKSFCATGWKVGWAMCSGHILKHLKTFHQNSVYHCPTAPQEAVAVGFQREYDVFGTEESYFRQLPAQLHAKRLKLAKSLRSVGLQPILPQGGYFMTTDISSLKVELNDPDTKDEPYDYRFVKWLIKEKGLAAIPVSGFYSPEHRADFQNYIRFCFVKDSTLEAAEDILRQWNVKK